MNESFIATKSKNIPYYGDVAAFEGLVTRVTNGKYAGKVRFTPVDSVSGYDEYSLCAKNGIIDIKATSGVCAGAAFNAYLNKYCGYYFGIMTESGVLPENPPDTDGVISEKSVFLYRYAFNFCTYGYTYAFDDWTSWERISDYLVLAGYNLVLNPIANEAVWVETLEKFGYSHEEAKAEIAAPNYLPWQWMMNMSRFESHYPDWWFTEQKALARRLNEKFSRFGIASVVPGYCGAVPADFDEKFKGVKLFKQGKWEGFIRPAILDYKDELFDKFSQTYYAVQNEIFKGTDLRYYSVDPFHEGGSTEGIDLGDYAKRAFANMKKGNPNAVWLLQGWQANPKRAMLSALNKNDVLIVNLLADSNPLGGDDFLGYPHIYCVVNNFGGQQTLRGSGEKTYVKSHQLAKGEDNSCVGVGAIPEGVESSEFLFDIISYLAVKTDGSLPFNEYLKESFSTRYHGHYEDIWAAWAAVFADVFAVDTIQYERESSLLCRPSLTVDRVSTWAGSAKILDNSLLVTLIKSMLAHYEDLKDNESYVKDLVEITRQCVADYGWKYVYGMQKAYNEKDLAGLKEIAEKYLALFDIQANLVDCDKTLNLQLYLDKAIKRGKTAEEKAWFERISKTLVTLWGDRQGSQSLHDYAAREYGDMLRYFYKPRWEKFIKDMVRSLEQNTELPQTDWYAFEYAFVAGRAEYNREISKELYEACNKALAAIE